MSKSRFKGRGVQGTTNWRSMMSGEWKSSVINYGDYLQNTRIGMYCKLLEMLALSRFRWINLPYYLDERFIEMTLFERGLVLFFYDGNLKRFMVTQAAYSGKVNANFNPTSFYPVGPNYSHGKLTAKEAVPIWDNRLRAPMIDILITYSERLAAIDRALDVNIDNVSLPMIIECEETQRTTILNLLQQKDQGLPVIVSYNGSGLADMLKTFPNTTPYLADKLLHDKATVWNEAMKFLGIQNNNSEKKERIVVDEVKSGESATNVFRLSYLQARQTACDQINVMYPHLDLGVEWGDTASGGLLEVDGEGGDGDD